MSAADEHTEPQRAQDAASSAARRAESGKRKQYREANRERIAAWRDANKERIARERKAARLADPEGTRAAERAQRERKRTRDAQRLKHNTYTRHVRNRDPEAARERSRRFRQENPDKVREYQRRYKERHPERARQSQAAAAQRYRDANAEAIRERQRLIAAEHRRERPDAYREWYERNLEAQRARGRQASRLRSRLKKAGLPPRTVRRVYASDRRTNEAAADEYFARERSVEELAVISTEYERRSALDLPREVRALRVQLLDGKLPAAVYLQRSVDSRDPESDAVEFTTKQYATALRRMRDRELEQLRKVHEQRVENVRASRPQIFEHHFYRRRAEMRDEIMMDSAARVQRGLEPYDLDAEMRRRVEEEVIPIVNAKLAAAKEAALGRVDEILARYGRDVDPAAPFQPPGSPPSSGPGLN
ncbi:hypothetical protein [Microbacterium sp. KHB019]|uniref:hypothetical protein n=1 Tax=Microbacterium sp. KHB019 TaxID=3129770 RepID=UPI003079E424